MSEVPLYTARSLFSHSAGRVVISCALPAEYSAFTGGRQWWSYRGTSLIRNWLLLGPYSRTMLKALQWSRRREEVVAVRLRHVKR